MTAGRTRAASRAKIITEAVKEEYLAGSDGDREKLEKKLLALEDEHGNPLYEDKNFAQWVSAADKKAEKAKDEKSWWGGGKIRTSTPAVSRGARSLYVRSSFEAGDVVGWRRRGL